MKCYLVALFEMRFKSKKDFFYENKIIRESVFIVPRVFRYGYKWSKLNMYFAVGNDLSSGKKKKNLKLTAVLIKI